ncbi:MAG: phosphorylase family protein [Candidatus Hodarchaeales archaeon]
MIGPEYIFRKARDAGNPTIAVYETVLIPFSMQTVRSLEEITGLEQNQWIDPSYHPYCTCKVMDGNYKGMPFSVAIPIMGASSMAVIIADLIAAGAKLIFLSAGAWSLSSEIQIGDFMLPTGSLGIDGTTLDHGHDGSLMKTDSSLVNAIKDQLENQGVNYFAGCNAACEAFYNINRVKIDHFKKKNCISMENGELNNLLYLGRKHRIKTCALFVSYLNLDRDECWNPETFKSREYITSTSLQARIFLNTAFIEWTKKKR